MISSRIAFKGQSSACIEVIRPMQCKGRLQSHTGCLDPLPAHLDCLAVDVRDPVADFDPAISHD
jgi:hypothetical protein